MKRDDRQTEKTLNFHEKFKLSLRNAAYLDKKRQNDIDVVRRLHQFSAHQLAISAIPKMEGQKDVDSGCESPEELSSKVKLFFVVEKSIVLFGIFFFKNLNKLA